MKLYYQNFIIFQPLLASTKALYKWVGLFVSHSHLSPSLIYLSPSQIQQVQVNTTSALSLFDLFQRLLSNNYYSAIDFCYTIIQKRM